MKHVVPAGESLFAIMERRPAPSTLPYQPHSATSRIAAGVAKLKAGSQRRKVYDYLTSRGAAGAADFEGIRDLKPELPTAENCYRARRSELVEMGLVRLAVGMKRISPAGLECDVWLAVTEGGA